MVEDAVHMGLASRALFPRNERDDDRTRVGQTYSGDDIEPADRNDIGNPGRVLRDLQDFCKNLFRALQRGAFRQLNAHEYRTLVFLGNETRRQDPEYPPHREKQNGQRGDDEQRMSDETFDPSCCD